MELACGKHRGVQQIFMSVSEIDDGNAIARRDTVDFEMACPASSRARSASRPAATWFEPRALSQHGHTPAAQHRPIPGRLRFSLRISVRADQIFASRSRFTAVSDVTGE